MKLREIIKWEQLSKKSFGDFDLNNNADLIRLIYVLNKPSQDFEAFKAVVLRHLKIFEKQIISIASELKYQEQFFGNFEAAEESKNDKKNTYSEIAAFLIVNGIDAHFVLEELELSEIYLLVKGIDTLKKEKMEQKRFWTFYQILPQIDAKKIKSPQDLILFDWEKDNRKNEEEQLEKESAEMFLKLQKKYNCGKA